MQNSDYNRPLAAAAGRQSPEAIGGMAKAMTSSAMYRFDEDGFVGDTEHRAEITR